MSHILKNDMIINSNPKDVKVILDIKFLKLSSTTVPFQKTQDSPWLVWLSGLSAGLRTACKLRGCRFYSQSGHMPVLWAKSPVGGVGEATDVSLSLVDVFLSFSLPSPLSKYK